MRRKILAFGAPVAAMAGGLAAAIGLSAPAAPPPLSHIGAHFDKVDFSALPAHESYPTRGGGHAPYRFYDRGAGRVAILLHGSSGGSVSLHPLAEALTTVDVAAPDIRGHGDAAPAGDVAYIGQPEDDLEDLIAHIRAERPEVEIALIGFSMGGGLALRFAAARPGVVDRLILLSPYLHHAAPPVTDANPFASDLVWANAAAPRIIGLSILNQFGLHFLDGLDVVAFAVRPEDAGRVTARYSHRLLASVNPSDWRGELAALTAPPTIIVGAEDELHHAPAFAAVAAHAPGAKVITLPGVDHMGLTLDQPAFDALTQLLEDWT